MTKFNDGGPAYPTTDGAMFEAQPDGNSIYRVAPGCNGMSLRDYFAAAVIPSLVSRHEDSAGVAYKIADAMLRARARVDS